MQSLLKPFVWVVLRWWCCVQIGANKVDMEWGHGADNVSTDLAFFNFLFSSRSALPQLLYCFFLFPHFAATPRSALIGCSSFYVTTTSIQPEWISGEFDNQFCACDFMQVVGRVLTRVFKYLSSVARWISDLPRFRRG